MDAAGHAAAPQPQRGDRGIPFYDVCRWRQDFPIFRRLVRGKPLVYLDNAATTQKSQAVIDAVVSHYSNDCSNVHRGLHLLSQIATDAYEGARERVRRFLHAADLREIVFVRGTTEAINLVADSFGESRVGPGDEVLVTAMEHHSNIVPWQILCQRKGARLRVAPVDDRGDLVLDEMERLLGPRTRILAVAHVSNALGTRNPVKRIVEMAHARGIPVVVDGAQAAGHFQVDVRDLGCDFYAFSGHKMYGPTGIGVLYARADLLEAMAPYQKGGDMIRSVTFEKTTFNDIPYRFEAGTPNIAGAIGLAAALDYLEGIGLDSIEEHERSILARAAKKLEGIPKVRLVGTPRDRVGVVSFVVEGIHPHDVGQILDGEGIAVRAGHHCAQPVMDRFGVPATARASVALYNTEEDVDALLAGVRKTLEVFG